tara:strand:- start:153 stop:893 length:741 start_codon:yes stop_codon:yes gene_type:complete
MPASINTDLLTSIAAGNKLTSTNSVAGRSTVLIGATVADYDSIDATDMFAVGATDGTVSIANNQEIVKLQSSAMMNPYAVIPTAYDFQISMTLQEVDPQNILLALSLKSANAETASQTGTNYYDVQAGGNDDYGNAHPFTDLGGVAEGDDAGKFDSFANLDPAHPGALKSMRIITLAPQATEGTVAYYAWDFYKVKIVSQGTIDFDRTANVSLPITAHCLGNNSDVVGRLWHTDTLSETQRRNYPS